MADVCAAPGPLSSGERNALPARYFGLPERRAYPLAAMVGGKAAPSASHARNALARASAELRKGNLTLGEYGRITVSADRVLRECGTMATTKTKKRTATKKKTAKRKATKKSSAKTRPAKRKATKKTAKRKATKKRGNPKKKTAAKKSSTRRPARSSAKSTTKRGTKSRANATRKKSRKATRQAQSLDAFLDECAIRNGLGC